MRALISTVAAIVAAATWYLFEAATATCRPARRVTRCASIGSPE